MPKDSYNEIVDIDLSVDMFGEDKENRGTLAYYDSGNKYNCRHSGDITNGGPFDGKGACEYIDLDMDALKEAGIRYVRCHVNSFNGQPLEELNVKFGWMEREELDRSEQFDITAVKQKSELSAPARGENTVIIDTYDSKVIWLDQPDFSLKRADNIGSSRDVFPVLMDRYGNADRMSMGRLAELAIEANHGEFTNNKEEADIIFTVDREEVNEGQRLITAKDNDIWIGEFMTPQTPTIDQKEINKEQILDRQKEMENEIGDAINNLLKETDIKNRPSSVNKNKDKNNKDEREER